MSDRKTDTQLSPQYNKVLDKRLSVASDITRDSLMSRYWGMRVYLEDTNTRRVLHKGLVDTNLYNNANWILEDTLFRFNVTEENADVTMVDNTHSRMHGTAIQIADMPVSDSVNKWKLYSVKKTNTNNFPAAIRSSTQKIDWVESSNSFTLSQQISFAPEFTTTNPYWTQKIWDRIIACWFERLVAVNEKTWVHVSSTTEVGQNNYWVATDWVYVYVANTTTKTVRKYQFDKVTWIFTFLSALVVGTNGPYKLYHIRWFLYALVNNGWANPYYWRKISIKTFTITNTSWGMSDWSYDIHEVWGLWITYSVTANTWVIYRFGATMAITGSYNPWIWKLRSVTSNGVDELYIGSVTTQQVAKVSVATFTNISVSVSDPTNACCLAMKYYPRTGIIYGSATGNPRSVWRFDPVTMTWGTPYWTQGSYYDYNGFISWDKYYIMLNWNPKEVVVMNLYDKYQIELHNENDEALMLSTGDWYDVLALKYFKNKSQLDDARWTVTTNNNVVTKMLYKGSTTAKFVLDWESNMWALIYVRWVDPATKEFGLYRCEMVAANANGTVMLSLNVTTIFENVAAWLFQIQRNNKTWEIELIVTGTNGSTIEWTARATAI